MFKNEPLGITFQYLVTKVCIFSTILMFYKALDLVILKKDIRNIKASGLCCGLMFVPLQNSYVEILILEVMVSADEALGDD